MAGPVAPQADVGALALSGLGSFTHVLAALSADNVTPLAMIQMEQLGSLFLVDGPYSHQVPELLKQAVSTPVGRLSLSVGWRRGDAISHLAGSAGGQAISLITVCLTMIYERKSYGLILSRLCSSLLPASAPRSAMAHLADVADQIASKLATIGFGNILAKQVRRVLDTYEQLGLQPDGNLMEQPSDETMIELLTCFSHLSKPGYVLRIIGSRGTAYILAIVLFLFPLKTMAAVESFVIHSNENPCIFVEINAGAETWIRTEHKVHQDQSRSIPIDEGYGHLRNGRASFKWDGWLKNILYLEFGRYLVICDESFRGAFCDLLVHLAPHYRLGTSPLSNSLEMMLGRYPRSTMESICQVILDASPGPVELSLQTAWNQFVSISGPLIDRVRCACEKCGSIASGWEVNTQIEPDQAVCPRHEIWNIVASALNAGLHSFLVRAHGSVAVAPRLIHRAAGGPTQTIIANLLNNTTSLDHLTVSSLYGGVLSLIQESSWGLAVSSGGSTLYPSTIETLMVDPDGVFLFNLRPGYLNFEGRYYNGLRAEDSVETIALRDDFPKELRSFIRSSIEPSSKGEHESLSITLREGFDNVELQLRVLSSGQYFSVNGEHAIMGYMRLKRTVECGHRPDSPLHDDYTKQISVTGVAAPRAAGTPLSIVMVKGNMEAQFLCCARRPVRHDTECLLVKDCCLNCAVKHAGSCNVLIVN